MLKFVVVLQAVVMTLALAAPRAFCAPAKNSPTVVVLPVRSSRVTQKSAEKSSRPGETKSASTRTNSSSKSSSRNVTAASTRDKTASVKAKSSLTKSDTRKVVSGSRSAANSKSTRSSSPAPSREITVQKMKQWVSPSTWSGKIFNTDYKTRSSDAPIPSVLAGNGLGGRNLDIGGEDAYRSSLPSDYMPTDLVLINSGWCYSGQVIYLRREAAMSMMQMFSDAARQGLTLRIVSGYRDYQHQMRLYLDSVRRHGAGQKTVARPGRSEHMLGTTADVTNDSSHLLSRSFADTREGRWLGANAARYGWKMTVMSGSGPRSHVDEPWHIRYLGCGNTVCPPEQKPSVIRRFFGFFGLGRK